MGSVLVQIVLIDVVFSLDSVITAVGMSNELVIMVLAVMIAVGVMMLAAGAISTFVEKHIFKSLSPDLPIYQVFCIRQLLK